MQKLFHVLTGDALREQFPAQLPGEIIVARECLVDGDVNSESYQELFQIRAAFISKFYEGYSEEGYYRDVVSEFYKIRAIPVGSEVNLWFEDDLFCQVNFWFTANLLIHSVEGCSIYLVRPEVHTRFGFGGLSEAELIRAFEERSPLSKLNKISDLWDSYKIGDTDKLLKDAKELKDTYPFILKAVEAHLARVPSEGHQGRPAETLLQIMEELKTKEFAPVFMEFNKRESIYGFGDLQVKRIFNELIKNN